MTSPRESRAKPVRECVAYLFTTYGRPSETFLRRELSAVRGLGVPVSVVSLWGGEESANVRRVPLREMLSLFWK
ncbi:MAG TPA: hypothetical protein PKI32_01100, partial [Opitutales bacterium]|nr:hypothetical protein [Opitutales bacterium]